MCSIAIGTSSTLLYRSAAALEVAGTPRSHGWWGVTQLLSPKPDVLISADILFIVELLVGKSEKVSSECSVKPLPTVEQKNVIHCFEQLMVTTFTPTMLIQTQFVCPICLPSLNIHMYINIMYPYFCMPNDYAVIYSNYFALNSNLPTLPPPVLGTRGGQPTNAHVADAPEKWQKDL